MQPLIKEPNDVHTITMEMRSLGEHINNPSLETLGKLMQIARMNILSQSPVPKHLRVRWPSWFMNFGAICMKLASAHFNADGFAQLLLEKHQKYGPGPIEAWGELGVAIRLDSKLARANHMATLPHNQGQFVAPMQPMESFIDTLLDMMGYCVLGFIYHREVNSCQGN